MPETAGVKAAVPMSVVPHSFLGFDLSLDGHLPEVRLRGEIDVSNADVLARQLTALAEERTDVVVDLSEVDFFGMAGLDALCMAARLLAEHEHRLLVRAPPAVTQRVIDVLDLDTVICVVTDIPLPPA